MPYIGNTTSDFSIDTGNITNRAVTATKLSPSSVGSNGQVLSVDGSGNLQWGNDANAPEGTAVLSTGESGTTKFLRVDGDGTCSWQLAVDATKTTLTGSTNNTICTVTGANAITGEANLTFNNSALSIINTSNLGDAFLYIKAGEAGASVIELQADEADDNNDLWRIQNAGDSTLGFRSKTSGSWVEKLGITADGHVGIGVTPSAWPTNADSIALQIGTGFAAYGRGSGDEDRGAIAVNYYNDGSSEKYIANGHSNRIYMADGNIDFQYAASNASGAGAALTFTSGIRMKADGKVGIGTTSPSQELTVYGSDPIISVQEASVSSQVDIGTGTSTGFINIQKADGTRTVQISGFNDSYFIGGDVGIGTTSPDKLLHLAGADTAVIRLENTDASLGQDQLIGGIEWEKQDASGAGVGICGEIKLHSDDSYGARTYLSIGTRHTSSGGSAVATESLRVKSDGNVSIINGNLIVASGHGIDFSATSNSSGSMTSELLDDYEEGTWTPNITFSNGGNTATYGANTGGWYVKVGRLVTLNGRIQITAKGAGSSAVYFGGLPFTVGNHNSGSSGVEGGLTFSYLNAVNADKGSGIIGGYASESTAQAIPFYVDTSNNFHYVEDFDLDSTASIGFLISYCV